MYKLNSKIASLTPYEPLKGDFRVRLDANESYLSLNKEIEDEIAQAVKKIKFNRYPDPLAENVCKAFAAYYGIDKDFITAGNGSDELISVIINAFFQKGDKVMVTSPDFSMYAFYCYIAETEAVTLSKTDGEISADEIICGAKKNGVKGLILSNPCNPTSKCLDREDILRIINSLSDILVVIDEAYMDFYGESLIENAGSFNNVIILKTCSKAFGLAAIRLGFAIACPRITNALRAVKSPYNVNSLTAVAGEVVLGHREYLKECTQKIIAQKEKLVKMLSEIEGIELYDSRSNFVFVKTEKAEKLYRSLLSQGIAIRCFGNRLRINAGSDEEQEIFIRVFKESL